MKVQELLRKIDANIIWKELFENHAGYDEEECEEFELPEDPSEAFINAIDEMRTIEPIPSQDGVLRRVVIIKHLDSFRTEVKEYYHVDLIHNNEDMRYACDLIDWAEFVDYDVCETSIKWYGEVTCAAEIYWEITFWGITNDDVIAKSDSILERSDEEDGEPILVKDLEALRGYVDERTEEEKIAQQKIFKECDRINRELYLRFLDEEIGAENVVEAEYDR